LVCRMSRLSLPYALRSTVAVAATAVVGVAIALVAVADAVGASNDGSVAAGTAAQADRDKARHRLASTGRPTLDTSLSSTTSSRHC
jgi:hypothetical protein